MLSLLLACAAPPSDATTYAAALHDGSCATVRDDALRDDCWLRWLDPKDPTWCDRLTTDRLRAECAFTMAERTGEATWCDRAGPFEDDCRLHHLSRQLADVEGLPADRDAEIEAAIRAAGLAEDDGRAWGTWYRWSLGRQAPLDRSTCDAVTDASRREACRQAGLGLFHDRLNNARDRKLFPCDGGPLPPLLAYAPDPDLDLAIQHRRPELCPR